MSAHAAARRLLPLPLVLGGGALGAASVVGAYAVHPLAVPAGVALVALALVSASRVELGIAAVPVLLALGTIGRDAVRPWVPATAWIGFLVVLLVLAWGARAPLRVPPLLPVLALQFAAVIAATAVAVDLETTVPVARVLIVGVALYVVIAAQITTRRQIEVMLAGLSVAVVLIGGYAAYQYLSGGDTPYGFFTTQGELERRVSAGFGHPNQLGGVLVLLLPVSLAAVVIHRRLAVLHGAAVLLALYGIYVSFSRGALVALVAIPVVWAIRRRALLLGLTVLVAAAAVVAAPGPVRERFATLSTGSSEVTTRIDFWHGGILVWREHPILGVGPGGFPDAYAALQFEDKSFLPRTVLESPPHAHNLVLNVLAEQGVLGLLALAALLAAATRLAFSLARSAVRGMRLLGTGCLAALLALLIQNMVDVTLLEATAVFFWFVVALMAAAAQSSRAAVEPIRAE